MHFVDVVENHGQLKARQIDAEAHLVVRTVGHLVVSHHVVQFNGQLKALTRFSKVRNVEEGIKVIRTGAKQGELHKEIGVVEILNLNDGRVHHLKLCEIPNPSRASGFIVKWHLQGHILKGVFLPCLRQICRFNRGLRQRLAC